MWCILYRTATNIIKCPTRDLKSDLVQKHRQPFRVTSVMRYNLTTDQREINKQTTNPSSMNPIYVYTNTSTCIRVHAIYKIRVTAMYAIISVYIHFLLRDAERLWHKPITISFLTEKINGIKGIFCHLVFFIIIIIFFFLLLLLR